jgi:hypothetical protein
MGVVEAIALSMGIGWASGINLYAAICMLGILGASGNLALPPDLLILQDPLVIGAAGVMYVVEFVADKVPGFDTGWDVIHTFIRVPAGAVLAAGAIGDVAPGAQLAAAIGGGTLAAGAHATKAGTRALINTSPEPFSNWTASIAEDLAVIGGLWVALQNPVLFLIALALFILLSIWLLPRIWRGLKSVFNFLRRKLGGAPEPEEAGVAAAGDGADT